MIRSEWIEHVSARLAAAIARETPRGLGRWTQAWEIVEAPSAAFLVAAREFEAGGGSVDAVKRAGLAVVEAWKRAAREWRAEVDAVA